MAINELVINSSITDDMINAVNELRKIGGGDSLAIVAGVIRNDGAGWDLITDANHDNINITSVSNDTSKIIVDYSGLSATKVVSFVVGNDETYAKLGYQVGSSVAKTQAQIFISQINSGFGGMVRYNTTGGLSLPWPDDTSISSVSWDAVNLKGTITHPYIAGHIQYAPTFTARRTCPANFKIDTLSGASVVFWFEDNNGTKIAPPDGAEFLFNRASGTMISDIDPNTVDNSIGNFWFIGVMEM